MARIHRKHVGSPRLYFLVSLVAVVCLTCILAPRGQAVRPEQNLSVPIRVNGNYVETSEYNVPFSKLYQPLKYSLCSDASPCWLRLTKDVSCNELFKEYSHVLQTYSPVFPAPKQLDAAQREAFLMYGFAKLKERYFDGMAHAPNAAVPVWDTALFHQLMQKAQAREWIGPYEDDCLAVYQALDCHPIQNQTGVVFGSETPWVEATLLASGGFDYAVLLYGVLT